MAIVKAPVPFSGVRANLVFVNGVSETNDAWLIKWFKEHGYDVTEKQDESKVKDEGGESINIGDKTVKELKAYAAEKNIDLGEAKTKADIIAAIEAAEHKVKDEGGEGGNE